ncbi:hypothetical protein [Fusibacter sp. JL216-2]
MCGRYFLDIDFDEILKHYSEFYDRINSPIEHDPRESILQMLHR